IEGAWSVLLRPGGFHRDHFHPQGVLSSAFYVETPTSALEREDRQGWIRFGQPPVTTRPALPAEHFVKPAPGRLVLFPSYMWHGTVPFTTNERRTTIAFDAVPA
ncbi:MAG: putative 2OG-Fe(II) oxygenase, partial [Phenylobacterium sp.]